MLPEFIGIAWAKWPKYFNWGWTEGYDFGTDIFWIGPLGLVFFFDTPGYG